jgi:ribosomal protein S19E (S16A)
VAIPPRRMSGPSPDAEQLEALRDLKAGRAVERHRYSELLDLGLIKSAPRGWIITEEGLMRLQFGIGQ